jgi:hypothetical protein
MRIVFGLLAVAAGCGDDGGMFPVGGGGNDGGLTFPDGQKVYKDAPIDSPADGNGAQMLDANLIMGRVCLLTDVRDMDDCATTGASGLTVRLGTASAVTTADGSFSIAGQMTAGLVWRVTGPNIVSSFEVLADYQIPAITTSAFAAMKAGSSPAVMEVPGEGSLMIYVSKNGAGAVGEIATPADTSPAFYFAYYDGATQAAWEQDSTGAEGAIWIPGIDVGSVSYNISGPAGDGTGTAPIFDGGITFANVILPPP